jgi:hypothetical protein
VLFCRRNPIGNTFLSSHDADLVQTVALDVNPHTEVSLVKTMLIEKQAKIRSSSPSGAPTDLVATLLYFLALLVQVRSSDIFLVSNGKTLVDEARLSDYSLGSTIHVAGRVRGGCFMLSATVFAIICCACVGSLCTCGMSLVVVPFLLPLLFILPLFCL